MQSRASDDSRRLGAAIGSVLLCIAGGIAVFVAFMTWVAACEADTPSECSNGPSFELVFQAVLAVGAMAAACVVRAFVNRRAYAPARAVFVATIVLLVGWLVLVDAVTHGWDDLSVAIALSTLLGIAGLLALVAAMTRRGR